MTKGSNIDIVRLLVEDTKTSSVDLFASMDPEHFEESKGPSGEDFRQELLKADAALREGRPHVATLRGDPRRRRR